MTDALTKIRESALELPGTEERVSHGQPTFFVAGKQFAQFRANHHGDEKTVVSYGSKPSAKYMTTYFRKTFTVSKPVARASTTPPSTPAAPACW